jgi:hypothetical protein
MNIEATHMGIEMRGLCLLIQVFDMGASLHFYCDLLGFEIVQKAESGSWAWLRQGNAEVMLNTIYEDDARPEKPHARRSLGIKIHAYSSARPMSMLDTSTCAVRASMSRSRRSHGTG